jgi:hypothetical protein
VVRKKTEPKKTELNDSLSARADETTELSLQIEEEIIELPGFEWSTLVNDLVIPASDIEQALWRADVTEPEHVFTKPNAVTGAFLTVLRQAIGDLKEKVRNLTST